MSIRLLVEINKKPTCFKGATTNSPKSHLLLFCLMLADNAPSIRFSFFYLPPCFIVSLSPGKIRWVRIASMYLCPTKKGRFNNRSCKNTFTLNRLHNDRSMQHLIIWNFYLSLWTRDSYRYPLRIVSGAYPIVGRLKKKTHSFFLILFPYLGPFRDCKNWHK